MPGPLAVYYITPHGHHNRFIATRKQATAFVLREGITLVRSKGVSGVPALREALAEHFRAFAYYASLERRLALTLAASLAAAATDPIQGGYVAGRCIFRAVSGL